MSGAAQAEPVAFEHHEGVGLITLDNPPVAALSLPLVADLRRQLRAAAASGVRALVVRSAVPGVFGAGADLKLLDGLDGAGYDAYLDEVRACTDQLAGLPAVTIAAIDGAAIGGGMELALACTFRVAGPDARLGLPEVNLGMLPGAGGTQRLTRLAGRDTALDLLLSGRYVDAEEALRLGLVSRLAPDSAGAEAQRWARSLATAPPLAVAAILRCVEAALPYGDPPGARVEAELARALFDTDDAREGIRAFLERRAAGR